MTDFSSLRKIATGGGLSSRLGAEIFLLLALTRVLLAS